MCCTLHRCSVRGAPDAAHEICTPCALSRRAVRYAYNVDVKKWLIRFRVVLDAAGSNDRSGNLLVLLNAMDRMRTRRHWIRELRKQAHREHGPRNHTDRRGRLRGLHLHVRQRFFALPRSCMSLPLLTGNV